MTVWTSCRECGEQTTFGAVCMRCSGAATIGQRPTYRERRERRAERLREWAEKREVKAEATLSQAHTMADGIPFGQPMLVDHYSYGRDRNYRERISRTFERGIEHQRKAESMASRAATIESQLDSSIYSDDPDAVERLRERIAGLEAERDRVKAFNATCRKGEPDWTLLTEREARNLRRTAEVSAYSVTDRAGRFRGFPSYHLTNLSGNIARQRKRLQALERKAS